MFHLGIEGCAAHYELAHLASECGKKFFTHLFINNAIDSGNSGKHLHIPFPKHGLDGRLVNLLKHKRDGNHYIRLHFLHGFQQQ